MRPLATSFIADTIFSSFRSDQVAKDFAFLLGIFAAGSLGIGDGNLLNERLVL